ncbi:MAG: hypothetical protein PUK85_09720, partial [Clostridia bacterium]|nr:hypothetical protein [Clostridia bacterium]
LYHHICLGYNYFRTTIMLKLAAIALLRRSTLMIPNSNQMGRGETCTPIFCQSPNVFLILSP